MASVPRPRPVAVPILATSALIAASMASGVARGDAVVLKNGTVYRGTVDRDNTLVFVNDNLKRVIFYNSKIAKVESDAGFSKLERFALVQPLEVHVGVQPAAAVDIQSTPWDAKGRRAFRYVNNKQRPVEMQQAINELGPYLTRFRGIDGFWQGQIATNQVPRPVVLGLLAKVDQGNQDERLKVTRWLIQAEWYPEALAALDGLLKDFPGDASMRERGGRYPAAGPRIGGPRHLEGCRDPSQGGPAGRGPRQAPFDPRGGPAQGHPRRGPRPDPQG